MDLSKNSISNIIESFHSNDVALASIEQLKKEFRRNGIDLQISDIGSTDYNLLINEVAHPIEFLIEKDLQRLMQLLYSVDIPDQLSKRAFNSNDPILHIAQLIVNRSIQKVLIRRAYSSGSTFTDPI